MRVAIVSESFLPQVNGVTNSVLRVLEHLQRTGHHAEVVAPGRRLGAEEYAGAAVHRLRSLPFPGYPEVRVTTTGADAFEHLLRRIGPDVVHLASPFGVGPGAVKAAQRLGIPAVAVFQTDVAGFATRYHLGAAAPVIWRRLQTIHQRCDLTLAPSRASKAMLERYEIPRVRLWRRGVDAERFSPAHRDERLRRRWAPAGEVVIGYLGRLAPEKQLSDLSALLDLRGVRLVLIGDGPSARQLRRDLPGAVFTGHLTGAELSRAVASLDLMVHPGPHETFCQSIQEALASGVPVVAAAAGGPLDLVSPSHNGWLYPVGDLWALRSAVCDLTGDHAKRRAFGRAARASVVGRSWSAVCDELLGHYSDARGARVG